MTPIDLVSTTGNLAADEAARDLVESFENRFPGRVRGYYVEGSYADETAVATSDLDVIVVIKSHWNESAGQAAAEALAEQCTTLSAIELDVSLVNESELASGAYPQLKLGSHLLYGEDIREHIPLLPIQEWTRQRMHAAAWLIVNVFNRPHPVRLPLTYPDPQAEFFGYDNRLTRLADGREVPTTRNLIRVTAWAATALVALERGHYVVHKRDCYRAYAEHIGDEWSTFLGEIYIQCRNRWNYLLPDDPFDRRALRRLCERALAWENHFLSVYKGWLLGELRSPNEAARVQAVNMLSRTMLQDDEILAALHEL
jgi:predicted nucleotidyltransferase